MFVSIPSRKQVRYPWATISLCITIWLVFYEFVYLHQHDLHQVWLSWGAITGKWTTFHAARTSIQDGSALHLFTALFLHLDFFHIFGNFIFLMLFGIPIERQLGAWRTLFLFLVGGAVANLVTIMLVGQPNRILIGASGAVSVIIGSYLALLPQAELGIVLPLGLFFVFIRIPAPILIGVWVILQLVFVSIGPTFGQVAWPAHLSGFLFGLVYGLALRSFKAKKLRDQVSF